MNEYEVQYINLLKAIYKVGIRSNNRTGINTRKIWGSQIYVDLQEGFPLLTTKKMHWKSVVHELLWMINGDTNIQYLLKNGVTFWTEWPYQVYCNIHKANHAVENNKWMRNNEDGTFSMFTQKEFEQKIINDDEFAKKWGSIGRYGYGGMWRRFPFYDNSDPLCNKAPAATTIGVKLDSHYETSSGYACEVGHVDQLVDVIDALKVNPDSRRIIITAWHPYHSNNREDALLPACHNYIQFGTEEIENGKRRLNCYFNMRSSDTFLGLPFNCAFYALFTHLIANQLNMIPGLLVYSAADVHLYENHLEQVELQLTRDIRELPRLNIKTPGKSIFDIKFEDIEILDYNPHPAIKGEVAV